MGQLYSHPDKPLKSHLLNVLKLGLRTLEEKRLNFTQDEEILLLAKAILVTHDFGKATDYFQIRLMQGDRGDQRANHGLYSALFTQFIARQLTSDPLFPLIAFSVVARHHGNLKDFRDIISMSDRDMEVLQEQFLATDLAYLEDVLSEAGLSISLTQLTFEELVAEMTQRKVRREWRRLKRKDVFHLENYLLTNMIYSVLIAADKGEAIFHSVHYSFEQLERMLFSRIPLENNLVDHYKKSKGWDKPKDEMNRKRNRIYEEIKETILQLDLKEKIYSINVPTGTGKTLASLAAAMELRSRLQEEQGLNSRIIYTLPFTSVIDQNYDVFKKVLEETGHVVDSKVLLKHHYLTPKSFSWKNEYDDQNPNISEHMVETWNSEIVVTTFVQLLHTIFSNQNRRLKKFHQLANSIILLDEVQSIPHHYWHLVQQVFEAMTKYLNCYFIFITATMPLIFNESEGEIVELARSKVDYFTEFDRILLNIGLIREPMTVDDFIYMLQDDLERYPDKSFLIVLNTIGTSLQVYKALRDQLSEEKLVYLSTNIVPGERLERIDRIKDATEPLVIVSTQMVEAGVDIDIDRVYRDFGPLDAINQTCGRCNRNFDPAKKGQVTLVRLINENHHNKPYGNYVYGAFLLQKTDQVLAELSDQVAEKQFFAMNQSYFKKVNQGKQDDDSDQLLDRIKKLKYLMAFEDDSGTGGAESYVFQLIPNDLETVNLFIEVDELAKKTWQQYIALEECQNHLERKAAFEEIKGEFLSYVITIPKRAAKKQLGSDQLDYLFNWISKDQLDGVYDFETGFVREPKLATSSF